MNPCQGFMIYINKDANGTSYRMGKPSKAIIAAGVIPEILDAAPSVLG